MALPIRDQLRYWGVAAIVFMVALWFLGNVLVPFLLGGAIAYFLDPVADRLEKLGLSRAWATAIITVVGVLFFVFLALLVIPTLVSQAISLVNAAPRLSREFTAALTERFPSLLEEGSTLRTSLASLGANVQERGGQLLETALASLSSLINVLVLLIVVPVVAVYMLLDWDRMTDTIDGLLPLEHAPTVRRLAREIDATLSAFVRGMGTVCFVLGTFYAVSLMVIGLQFGAVVGFVAGILTFIPYLGALLGGALALGLALFQFWGEWVSLGLVAGVFWVGQVLEGNVLTPKLVGSSVGLHPVWLLLALSVFGTLFGFVGLLVAVPVAAALGVLARFGVELYQDSLLYQGSHPPAAEDDEQA